MNAIFLQQSQKRKKKTGKLLDLNGTIAYIVQCRDLTVRYRHPRCIFLYMNSVVVLLLAD